MTKEEKIKDFKQFECDSKDIFYEFNREFRKHSKLRKLYGFSVISYGKEKQDILGDMHRVIVCFNDRNMNIEEKEIAPKLIYQCLSNRDILINLFPAYTDNYKLDYDFIMIDRLKNTSKLKNKLYLRRHYNYLVSCLANTSNEYEPNTIEKIRFFLLKKSKRLAREKKVDDSVIKINMYKNICGLLSLVCSGFILVIITFLINYNSNREFSLKIETIIENLDKINSTLNVTDNIIEDVVPIIDINNVVEEHLDIIDKGD